MKKTKLNRKLTLTRETVKQLQVQSVGVAGAGTFTVATCVGCPTKLDCTTLGIYCVNTVGMNCSEMCSAWASYCIPRDCKY